MKSAFRKPFKIKDLGEVKYILGVQIIHDHPNQMIYLSQEHYIHKLGEEYSQLDAKPVATPLSSITLTTNDCPLTPAEQANIAWVPWVDSCMLPFALHPILHLQLVHSVNLLPMLVMPIGRRPFTYSNTSLQHYPTCSHSIETI